jgi:hypothetical protein
MIPETKLERLWAQKLPEVKMPEARQFVVWLEMSYGGVTIHAIKRTGRKYRNALATGVRMTPNDCERYVTSVIVKERNPLTRDAPLRSKSWVRYA